MSADLEDDGGDLEDRPPSCFTYFVVIRIVAPGKPIDGALHDVEFISEDGSLSDAEIQEQVDPIVQPWLAAFCGSPRAVAAGVTQCDWEIAHVGIVQGC
jgi:hypothetical protein